MSFSDLIGRPWALPCNPPQSFDCWELAVEVRDRLGLTTPAYKVPPQARTAAHRRDLGGADPKVWKRLERPVDGCLVGFGSVLIKHCGVYFNRRVMHSVEGSGVMYQEVSVLRDFFGPVSFWELIDG